MKKKEKGKTKTKTKKEGRKRRRGALKGPGVDRPRSDAFLGCVSLSPPSPKGEKGF